MKLLKSGLISLLIFATFISGSVRLEAQEVTNASFSLFEPRGIDFWKGEWWAVSRAGGLYRSLDGINWTVQPGLVEVGITDGNTTLNDIGSTGDRLCIVGNNGLVLTSPDGETWTSVDVGTTNALNAVDGGDVPGSKTEGALMIVGNSGTVLISTESGNPFTSIDVGTTQRLNSVSVTEDEFVVGGFSSSLFATPSAGEVDELVTAHDNLLGQTNRFGGQIRDVVATDTWVYVADTSGGVYAVNRDTSTLHVSSSGGSSISAMAVSDQNIYLGSFSNQFLVAPLSAIELGNANSSDFTELNIDLEDNNQAVYDIAATADGAILATESQRQGYTLFYDNAQMALLTPIYGLYNDMAAIEYANGFWYVGGGSGQAASNGKQILRTADRQFASFWSEVNAENLDNLEIQHIHYVEPSAGSPYWLVAGEAQFSNASGRSRAIFFSDNDGATWSTAFNAADNTTDFNDELGFSRFVDVEGTLYISSFEYDNFNYSGSTQILSSNNGSSWSIDYTNDSNFFTSLLEYSGQLYALGGNSSTSNFPVAVRISAQNWSASSVSFSDVELVKDAIVFGDNIAVLVSPFNFSGSHRVISFNGSSAGSSNSFNYEVESLATDGTTLYVLGSRNNSFGKTQGDLATIDVIGGTSSGFLLPDYNDVSSSRSLNAGSFEGDQGLFVGSLGLFVSIGEAAQPPATPLIRSLTLDGSTFTISFDSEAGANYELLINSTSLRDGFGESGVPAVVGDGTTQDISYTFPGTIPELFFSKIEASR